MVVKYASMSYSELGMETSPNATDQPENPHRKYLKEKHLAQIQKVMAGEMAAEQLAEELAQKQEELEYQADHDGLTGILNFQGFMDAIAADLAIIHQFEISAYLALLDGDRLREINKTKGKLAGNKVIQAYATVLNNVSNLHTNLPMVIGRFGGDEFAMLIIGGQKKEVQQVLEEIRGLIPLGVKDALNDPDIENTVSIGAVTVQTNDDAQTLIERADQNLDNAKITRNAIFFDQLPISEHM